MRLTLRPLSRSGVARSGKGAATGVRAPASRVDRPLSTWSGTGERRSNGGQGAGSRSTARFDVRPAALARRRHCPTGASERRVPTLGTAGSAPQCGRAHDECPERPALGPRSGIDPHSEEGPERGSPRPLSLPFGLRAPQPTGPRCCALAPSPATSIPLRRLGKPAPLTPVAAPLPVPSQRETRSQSTREQT